MNDGVENTDYQRFKNVRENILGLKQKDYAKRLDVLQSFVSEVEAGKKPLTYKVLMNLYKNWRINPLYILFGWPHPIKVGAGNDSEDVVNEPSEPQAPYGKGIEEMTESELLAEQLRCKRRVIEIDELLLGRK